MPIDPEEFKTRDAGSYDSVADRFGYWTDRVTSALARDVVEIGRVQSGERVLDVGAGSGVVTFAAAKHAGATGQVIGIDLSEGMLRVARSKLVLPDRVEFLQMDAEYLKFPDTSFDVALSLFAVLHFPHPRLAVREMFRVIKPEGRVVLGIGSSRTISWRNIVSLGIRLRENRNSLVAPEALDRFIAERLPRPTESETPAVREPDPLSRILYEAGFRNLRRDYKSYTHQIETAADFWDLQTTFSSTVRKRLQAAPPAVVEHLRAEFTAKCNAILNAGGRLIYRNGAAILSAIRS